MARLILIHGGAHGAWCWERVLEPLRSAGHEVEAIDLPGRGETAGQAREATLEGHVASVCAALDAGPMPAVIVAHSMGGVTAAAVAERRPKALSKIVFVTALVPTDGEAGLPILQTRAIGSRLLEPGGIVLSEDQMLAEVPADAAAEGFYSDCTAEEIAWATPQLCWDPIVPMMTPLSLSAEWYGSVPKTYVLTTEDRTIPPFLQREMAEAAGARIVEFGSGHSPFLSRPAEFAGQLNELL